MSRDTDAGVGVRDDHLHVPGHVHRSGQSRVGYRVHLRHHPVLSRLQVDRSVRRPSRRDMSFAR